MTFSLDFRPRRDGLPYDPQQFGGSVDFVRVFTTPARDTAPITEAGPAVRISPGLYRFTLPDLPDGTYYTTILWTESASATTQTSDTNDRFTLPVPDPVIARLRRLVAEPDPEGTYTDDDMARYLDENTDAQGRVDIYGAAADVWEEKSAALAEREVDGRSLNSVRTGDQGVVYSTTTRAAVELAQERARFFRAKSVAKSRRIQSPGAHAHLLRPEQADAGLGHAYSPEALALLGLEP